MPDSGLMRYSFLTRLARMINSGATNSIILHGNVEDLFFTGEAYLNLGSFLREKWSVAGKIFITYELNGPIRFNTVKNRNRLKNAWKRWEKGDDFEKSLQDSIGRPTMALELLRQFCICSRTPGILDADLIIVIEAADMLLPVNDSIAGMTPSDRHRVSIAKDWFSDPGFIDGRDCVLLISESSSGIHDRISRLPFVSPVEIPSPDLATRKHYISWFKNNLAEDSSRFKLWSSQRELAELCAGLNIHALRQMLKEATCFNQKLSRERVIEKVEEFVKTQLGNDVVEFKKPSHSLDRDVVGSHGLKQFIHHHLIPRMTKCGKNSLTGAAISGPIGSGKTFIFEAVAAELNMPVLVLKQIRSQWFGQTDLIFERLKRVLEALSRVMIFIDEADTQFGTLDGETHSTEKRLTGKIQSMMSEPRNRGRIFWFLLTARIHLLSADIRRSGRAGDLIIPVIDPEGEDRRAFLAWILKSGGVQDTDEASYRHLLEITASFYPATFALLRNEVKAVSSLENRTLSVEEISAIAADILPGSITEVRKFQTLQALVNCSRKSLLPEGCSENDRCKWLKEIDILQRKGIR
jgi:hypothetical protein